MRIAVAQLDPVVGDFSSNATKIKVAYERACRAQARLLLTPELGLCGYPPHDLIDRPEMLTRTEQVLAELQEVTLGQRCALIVGHVSANPSNQGRAFQNTVSVIENGQVVFSQAKTLLPTYDVFDEARYFEPADGVNLWRCDGIPVALAVCEDLWARDSALGRRIYGKDPIDRYREEGAQLILSVSSSPYEWAKRARREALHSEVARELDAPVIYVNQVGGNDEILFDGGSFAMDSKGQLQGRLPIFKSSFGVVEVSGGDCAWVSPDSSEREDEAPSEIEALTHGLIAGIRDYFARTGFQRAILGLSGGIDSAVVAVLAAQALGAKNVLGIAMPSQYSSSHSLEDAEALARKAGMAFEVRPIKFLFATAKREFAERRGELNPIALENLQARLRGVLLMTLSNHDSALVLTTGNKSETALGYCTMYGDMCGALAPIGDLYKTRVYELARHLNQEFGALIPERTLSKAPSAELRPDQTDQDTLPPYEDLDAVLAGYLEERLGVRELESRFGFSWIPDVLRKIELNEYKRRQAAPVLKVTPKAFGAGRRIPIAKHWDV